MLCQCLPPAGHLHMSYADQCPSHMTSEWRHATCKYTMQFAYMWMISANNNDTNATDTMPHVMQIDDYALNVVPDFLSCRGGCCEVWFLWYYTAKVLSLLVENMYPFFSCIGLNRLFGERCMNVWICERIQYYPIPKAIMEKYSLFPYIVLESCSAKTSCQL